MVKALEALDSLQEKLDGLTLDMQRNQGETVKLLYHLQDQMKSLESQMQTRFSSGEGNATARSARRQSKSQDEIDMKPSLSSPLKKTDTKGPTEFVPLLEKEGSDNNSSNADRRSEAMNSITRRLSTAGPNVTRHEKLKLAKEAMHAGKSKQSWSVKVVTAFLEDPESSFPAELYSNFMLLFTIFCIVVGLLPYVDLSVPDTITLAIDSLLFLEIFVRGVFCPNLKAFFRNPSNLIDGLSATPLVVMSTMECGFIKRSWGNDFLLFAVPVIRFLRLVRRFPKMQILISAFKDCLEALPVLMYTLVVMGCIFASAIFLAEPRDNIESLSDCAWFVITTISTVGYGDITPETKCGSALTSFLMVVSQLYMAMPFGIIGYSFTEIWGNRAQILLLNGTRERLAKWGFGPYQMPYLFQLYDLDSNDEIDLEEFLALIQEMEIGFREEDVVELFKIIDKDSGGTIDEREFVKTLYPKEFRYIYGNREQ